MIDTNNENRIEDGQLLMLGERVENGKNQHDVYYQIRRVGTLWLIYCHNKPTFAADPLWGNHYDEWLQACAGTPHHPKSLNKGWVIVDMESSEQDARETLADADRDRVAAELSQANMGTKRRVDKIRTSSGQTTDGRWPPY
jgi:hypothetical protein